ncbi:glycosyltransferase family 2 protein [Hutsoniella sourekii]
MEGKPLVSVIIPCYNAELTISETLNSVINQTYKNVEIIIVNDGSTDNTVNLIENLMSKSNANIRLLNQKNKGVSVARNLGIECAKGSFLTFLDSDDLFSPIFIKSLVNAIGLSDVSFSIYTRDISQLIFSEEELKKEYLDKQDLMRRFMFFKGPITWITFLYRSEIIKSNNIRFDENLKYGEDLLFAWKYICHCSSALALDKPLFYYRQNKYSAMNTVSWNMVDVLSSVSLTAGYIKEYQPNFFDVYFPYMHDRSLFKLVKDFSINNRYDYFIKLGELYNINKSMKNLIFNADKISIKIMALIYYLNPRLFFQLFKCYGTLVRKR